MASTIASRVARAEVLRGREPAGERVGELADGVRADLEGEPGAGRLRDGRRERAGDLAEAGVVRDDRQRPARGRLGGDHAERLGERARDRHRLGGGEQVGELGVVEPAGERDAVAQAAAPRRGRRRRPRARSRKAAQLRQLAPSSPRVRAAASRSPAASVRREPLEPLPERPEPDDHEPRPRLAREHERPARPAAARRPWTRSACRRRPRAGPGLDRVERRRRPRRTSRANEDTGAASRRVDLVGGCGERASAARRSRSALEARAGRVRLARGEAVDVHARRAEAGAAGQRRVVHLGPQALGGVARADEHAARARQALDRERPEARVRLDGVLQRAAVDLDRVRDVRRSARARIAGPITRWFASATSGRHARDDLAHGGDVGVQVAVDLGVAELRGTGAPRCRRSVGDVDRQQAADVRPVDGRARRASRRSLDDQRPGVPVARRVDPVQRERARSWQSRCTSCPARTSAAPSSAL